MRPAIGLAPMGGHTQVVIWGSAGHAKVVADVIALHGGAVVALVDNNPDAEACLDGVPLLIGWAGLRGWLRSRKTEGRLSAAIAVGGGKGADRQQLLREMCDAGFDAPCIVHPTASLSRSARIGAGCHVLANSVIAADSVLGDACIVNNSASVDHECQLSSGVHIAPGAVLCGCVTVDENAFVGAGAVVLPRIRIGRGAVVGAGSVVSRDVADNVTVVGVPARGFGKEGFHGRETSR